MSDEIQALYAQAKEQLDDLNVRITGMRVPALESINSQVSSLTERKEAVQGKITEVTQLLEERMKTAPSPAKPARKPRKKKPAKKK